MQPLHPAPDVPGERKCEQSEVMIKKQAAGPGNRPQPGPRLTVKTYSGQLLFPDNWLMPPPGVGTVLSLGALVEAPPKKTPPASTMVAKVRPKNFFMFTLFDQCVGSIPKLRRPAAHEYVRPPRDGILPPTGP